MPTVPESPDQHPRLSTPGQSPDPPAADQVESLDAFLALFPDLRPLDNSDAEDEPLPAGFRLLGPEDQVAWSPRSYPWPQRDGLDEEEQW